MELSRGAQRLLNHLENLCLLPKGAIKFQRTLAAKWNVTTRTIRRWLAELKGLALVNVIRRGRTSAKIEMSARMSAQEAKNVRSNGVVSILTENLEKQRAPPQRKPVQRERRPIVNWHDVLRLHRGGMPFEEAVLAATA